MRFVHYGKRGDWPMNLGIHDRNLTKNKNIKSYSSMHAAVVNSWAHASQNGSMQFTRNAFTRKTDTREKKRRHIRYVRYVDSISPQHREMAI